MKNYQPQFHALLKQMEIDHSQLSEGLQNLINKFEAAYHTLMLENKTKQFELLNALAQSDAVISAAILRFSGTIKVNNTHQEPSKVDKTKVMAMKTKALQLKMNMKKIYQYCYDNK